MDEDPEVIAEKRRAEAQKTKDKDKTNDVIRTLSLKKGKRKIESMFDDMVASEREITASTMLSAHQFKRSRTSIDGKSNKKKQGETNANEGGNKKKKKSKKLKNLSILTSIFGRKEAAKMVGINDEKEQDSIEKRGSKYLLDIQTRMIEAINMINRMGSKQIELLIVDANKPIETISEEIQSFLEQ